MTELKIDPVLCSRGCHLGPDTLAHAAPLLGWPTGTRPQSPSALLLAISIPRRDELKI